MAIDYYYANLYANKIYIDPKHDTFSHRVLSYRYYAFYAYKRAPGKKVNLYKYRVRVYARNPYEAYICALDMNFINISPIGEQRWP